MVHDRLACGRLDRPGVLDHPLGNPPAGQALVTRAAEDAQDVVLRRRKAKGFEDRFELRGQHVRGAQDVKEDLLLEAGERTGLVDFLGELAGLTEDLVAPSAQPLRLDASRSVAALFTTQRREGRWVIVDLMGKGRRL